MEPMYLQVLQKETGRQIKKLLVENGYTVKDVQNAMGFENPQAVYKWISGRSLPSLAKHRRRREKEHRDKEILPIYIVNHQRYIRPSLRQNPPFSDNQIDYAKNDERGLLTTWQLYNQYKLIENGIFTKKETRESLDKWGLISLLPKNLIRVGIYEEYFKKPKAGILTLNNVKLEVGKMIYAKKDGKWICTSIVSIQLNDKDVDQVDNGEVGIVTDIELEKGYEIFVKIE